MRRLTSNMLEMFFLSSPEQLKLGRPFWHRINLASKWTFLKFFTTQARGKMEKQDNDKVTVVLSKRLCKVLQAYAWHAGDCEDIGACYTLSSLFRKLATVDSVTLDDPDFDKVKLTGGCLEDDFPYICSDSAHEVEAEIEAIKDKI